MWLYKIITMFTQRINNDIHISQRLIDVYGNLLDISNTSNIELELISNATNSRYPLSYILDEDYIKAVFLAKRQKHLGRYTLSLKYTNIHSNKNESVAVDYCDLFEIVPTTKYI